MNIMEPAFVILAVACITAVLQLAGVIVTAGVLRVAGVRSGWTLVVIAMVLLLVERVVSLVTLADLTPPDAYAWSFQMSSLLISGLLMVGGIRMVPRFVAIAEAEALMQEQETAFHGVLDNMADTYYRTDPEGRIVLGSRAGEQLLGLPIPQLIGLHLSDFYADANDRAEFLKALQDSPDGVQGYEALMRRADGSEVWVETSARYYKDLNGNVAGVEGIGRDITERKAVETMTQRLGRIVENSVNEIFVFDSESLRFTLVNRGARENLGYTMPELRQMTPADINPEYTEQQFRDLVAPVRRGEVNLLEFETVHECKDGSQYDADVLLHIAPAEGSPVFFAIIMDSTERRRAEERLAHAQKLEAVGQLTGGLAHDLNNILTAVILNLEMAQLNCQGNADLERYVKEAHDASLRGVSLTQRMLAFARKQALAPNVVNINDLVVGLTQLMERTIGPTIPIAVSEYEGLWPCMVDPSQLENALLNLAINSRDAMPQGGRLEIATSNAFVHGDEAQDLEVPEGDYVLLSVKDIGSGMPANVVERAFNPFFTTKEAGHGSGLGLSMVFGFAKQSGGGVRIASELGEGTCIDIVLPRYVDA